MEHTRTIDTPSEGSRFVTQNDGSRSVSSARLPGGDRGHRQSPSAILRSASPSLDCLPDDIKFDVIYMITITRMARFDGESPWQGSKNDRELFVANARHYTAAADHDYGVVYDELVEHGMVNAPAI